MNHNGNNSLLYFKMDYVTCHKYSSANLNKLGFGWFGSTSYLDCPIQTCQNTCLLAGNVFYFLSKYDLLQR